MRRRLFRLVCVTRELDTVSRPRDRSNFTLSFSSSCVNCAKMVPDVILFCLARNTLLVYMSLLRSRIFWRFTLSLCLCLFRWMIVSYTFRGWGSVGGTGEKSSQVWTGYININQKAISYTDFMLLHRWTCLQRHRISRVHCLRVNRRLGRRDSLQFPSLPSLTKSFFWFLARHDAVFNVIDFAPFLSEGASTVL
jgi:hypothetical protein